jgi:L-alanine-DL-glutamate epimerase-like enolase superfamily enzyme
MTSVTIDRVLLRQINLPPKLERTDAIQSFVTQETILLTLEDITHSRMKVEDGFAIPPDAHGLGIDWNWDAIEKRQKIYLEIQHAT